MAKGGDPVRSEGLMAQAEDTDQDEFTKGEDVYLLVPLGEVLRRHLVLRERRPTGDGKAEPEPDVVHGQRGEPHPEPPPGIVQQTSDHPERPRAEGPGQGTDGALLALPSAL